MTINSKTKCFTDVELIYHCITAEEKNYCKKGNKFRVEKVKDTKLVVVIVVINIYKL